MNLNKFEMILLNIAWSSFLAVFMYIFTVMLLWQLDGIKINELPIGIVALMSFFMITFVTTYLVIIEGE